MRGKEGVEKERGGRGYNGRWKPKMTFGHGERADRKKAKESAKKAKNENAHASPRYKMKCVYDKARGRARQAKGGAPRR